MERFTRLRRIVVVGLLGLFLGLLSVTGTAQGTFNSQIVAALRVFVTQAHTWTALQTFSAGIVTSSCTGCGLADAFTSIPVSGQTTVTASGSTALTLAAGSNVTLTTDNAAKSVTIAASGGAATCGTNGQVCYNNSGAFGGIAGSSVSGPDIGLAGTLTIATANGDVAIGSGNTLVPGTTVATVMHGINNTVTAGGDSIGSVFTIVGVNNTLTIPDAFEANRISMVGSGNSIAAGENLAHPTNDTSIFGSNNYITNVADASQISIMGLRQSVSDLDDANETTLLGMDNAVFGLSGGTAVATFLIGQGNSFSTTDETSVTDSTFVYGWNNNLTVPTMATWDYTISVGVDNVVGFGQTMTFGHALTPTAANQTWFGDTAHPVFFAASSDGFTFNGGIITAATSPAVANIGANSCGTSAASAAGTDNAPVITTGATAWTACRVTFDTTAPNGWNCAWSNGSTHTLAATPYQSASSATTVDVTASSLGVAADVLTGVCFAR